MEGPNAHDASIAVALAFVHGCADDPQSEHESIEPDDSTAAALKCLRQPPLSRAKCLERARYAKLKKKKLRVAPHVRKRIQKHNSQVVRVHEQINLEELKEQPRTKGWTPTAMLSACWAAKEHTSASGTRSAWRMRRLRGIKRKATIRAAVDPNARPLTVMAQQRKASTQHLVGVRSAVCQVAMEHQREVFQKLEANLEDVGFLEVSFDETEIKVSVEKRLEHARKVKHMNCDCSVMITHGTLWWPGNVARPLVCPASGLDRNRAADMYAVLTRHLGETCGGLDRLSGGVGLLILIVISDAAKANKKLVRHLVETSGPNVVILHLLCFMHQVFSVTVCRRGVHKIQGGGRSVHGNSTNCPEN